MREIPNYFTSSFNLATSSRDNPVAFATISHGVPNYIASHFPIHYVVIAGVKLKILKANHNVLRLVVSLR